MVQYVKLDLNKTIAFCFSFTNIVLSKILPKPESPKLTGQVRKLKCKIEIRRIVIKLVNLMKED